MDNDTTSGLVSHYRRIWLYLFVVAALFFLILPILIVIPMSFSDSRFLDFPPDSWSLRWYRQYLTTPEWIDATFVTLQVSFFACLLSTPLGVAAAYGIHVSGWPLMKRIQVLLLLPLMVPHIIIAIGLFFVLANLHLINTLTGLIVANTMLTLPFVLVTTLAGLRNFDMNQEKVARSLGYNRFWAFILVTLPQIKGSVVSGMLFAFIIAVDEVIVALFISGGLNTTLTKIMFTALRDEIDPTIAAISSILIVTSLVVGFAASFVNRDRRQ
ncbi:ABC transporter permease [Oceanibacterium hippocampi]|uniref:Inner membrane ABC transporter permease protein YdcV n=1 Tax=Oceanibacterium hippocampi TaxID=745714 RepID=A0A1Y5TJV7_9PROT|nr:ABC transporter permease [Oceanibacterium hippocampi]SLN65309.1 Inner membrane ABC transporter permease protein YdcV [Oceanibacterium hippocampi]